MAPTKLLELEQISKRFGSRWAVRDLSVSLAHREILGGSAPSFLMQEGIPVGSFALLAAALAGWVYRRRL